MSQTSDDITITVPDYTLPVYSRYPREIRPQPAYLEIDPQERTVTADYSGEIGNAVPASVWHGVILRVPIPSDVLRSALCHYLEQPETLALLRTVIDGHEVRLDRQSNHVGVLDGGNENGGPAGDALVRLEWELAELETGQVCQAGDWIEYGDSCGITAATTDEQLAAIKAELQSIADRDGIHMVEGLDDELERIRERIRAEEAIMQSGDVTEV